MLLLVGVMATYAKLLEKEAPDAKLAIFVDDRILWARKGTRQVAKVVDTALEVTEQFDQKCKFKWNLGKGCLFSSSPAAGKQLERRWKTKASNPVCVIPRSSVGSSGSLPKSRSAWSTGG